uniref:Glycerophosphocholine phosphodiesterase n=1 Tax=Hydatigena taeniaeformis TaxID=6205 RepID=A0A0R3WQC6_HYDTA
LSFHSISPLKLSVHFTSEMDNFFERNLYVDTILREIFKYAGNRRILFSCFDPDTYILYPASNIHNNDELLRNPGMAEFARDLGLIVLVWGSAANDSCNMKRLKELGVHGLIYDRFVLVEKCAPVDSTGHSTPSPPSFESPTESHESGASTPSHQNYNHQNQPVSANSASVVARDLVDALNKQLCLNRTSNEENEHKMTLTLTN